jgi:hypothetical protein
VELNAFGISEPPPKGRPEPWRVPNSQPETGFYALYTKPSGEPQLKAQHMPLGTHEFKARAWQAANDKARELGWIVSDATDD